MNIRERLLSLMLSVTVVATLSFSVRAAGVEEDSGLRRMVNATAPVSLTVGQTLRINFFNSGGSPVEIIPCIVDGDGAHIKTWAAIRLGAGRIRSFELPRDEAGRRTEPAVLVRAGVHASESDLKHLVASGEVVEDATSRTTLFVPGVANPPVRSGESETGLSREITRSLAPVSITDGQLLRVNYLNIGSSPLEIIPCIFDGAGAHLKTGPSFILTPGQTISFELNRAEAGPRTEPHVVVRGAAHVRPTDAQNLLVTGEVTDTTSGRSSLLVPGARVAFDPQPDPPGN